MRQVSRSMDERSHLNFNIWTEIRNGFEQDLWDCPEELRRFKDSNRVRICQNFACKQGRKCTAMAALGLDGSGQALLRSKRPYCGARTRTGGTCNARIVPGKRRCRMHGGLSTGPRTEEGRRKIAVGQYRRWAKLKQSNKD